MTGPVIETERLILRKPNYDDAEGAAKMLGDMNVMEWLGGETVPPEAMPAVIDKWLERWDENGCGPFSIIRREDGCWLGRAGILVWDTRGVWTHGTLSGSGEFAQPELGWALTTAYWGSGYATEATGAAREWAYAELGFERLVSVIRPDNVRSQGVAQRLNCTPGETVNLFDGGPHVVWTHPR